MWSAWLCCHVNFHVDIMRSSDSDDGGDNVPADDAARDLNIPVSTTCSSNSRPLPRARAIATMGARMRREPLPMIEMRGTGFMIEKRTGFMIEMRDRTHR